MIITELDFISYQQQAGIQLEAPVYEKLFDFIKILLKTNETVNLTAITDYSEALMKHLYDSLVILNLPAYQNSSTILDVGSGGGIPGIPLAICSPEKTITSLEATSKKINFQKETGVQLNLTNHLPVWGRAEELGHQTEHREKYDLVIARALAATNTLIELTLPFIALSGYALFYKAKNYQDEITDAQTALQTVGGEIESVHNFKLPGESVERNIIIIKKVRSTPKKYPRRSGLPQKSPIR
ncbi:MAG TPA: 16S rRNA (guanine(527)-N(7))-methyltransferase RsmG [Bacillota bacterium]|nr:16S rRNA (guanine(527)-N(7))-methyltransferase RsmG [Bacillota bacterium]